VTTEVAQVRLASSSTPPGAGSDTSSTSAAVWPRWSTPTRSGSSRDVPRPPPTLGTCSPPTPSAVPAAGERHCIGSRWRMALVGAGAALGLRFAARSWQRKL